MFLTAIVIAMLVSVTVHLISIILFFLNRSRNSFILFIGTFVTNLTLLIIFFINVFTVPDGLNTINFKIIMWLLSGFGASVLLYVKIYIAVRSYKRTKDETMYHKNYFGKKVYHGEVVTKNEFLIFILSIPFFLLLGSYFIARLINLIRTGAL